LLFGKNHNSKDHSKFDIINSQLMIHYLLKNDITWNNFCDNVNKYLNNDGYLLITTVNGDLLHDSFNNNVISL